MLPVLAAWIAMAHGRDIIAEIGRLAGLASWATPRLGGGVLGRDLCVGATSVANAVLFVHDLAVRTAAILGRLLLVNGSAR